MSKKVNTAKKIGTFTLAASMLFTGFTESIAPIIANEASIVAAEMSIDGYNTIGAVSNVSAVDNKVNLTFETGEKMQLTFLSKSIFRMYLAPDGEEFKEYPDANSPEHTATIAVNSDASLADGTTPNVSERDGKVYISTDEMILEIDKTTSLMKLSKADGTVVWEESAPLKYKDGETKQTLKTTADEYFYGGGTQNGRFSHKGQVINVKNENNWVDQGVASPNPFYWSTKGYGVLRNTFRPGVYDFGSSDTETVVTTHTEKRFDAYYFVGDTPADLLKGYYTVTGNPVELPEYASYLGHLNCYNRDYWIEVPEGTSNAVKIGDKWYSESQTDNGGKQESLLGEGDLTAQKIIEEHKEYDMPLGWFLPNDGYGCGYGQTTTQAGDIDNLSKFADYAINNGIRTGLWTQSNLWPEDPTNPQKGERDIYKEVEAGVESVKTDVAWVGAGYSMALNGISVAYDAITSKSGSKANIVTLDGWAGSQRYAGIWTGDQTGGKWEYIRFHIPTYIGTALSGQPNVGSDMDGIFGGGDKIVQTRDFQWKAFTTYMLDMDGWGSNQKSPWALGEDGTSINRAYLKLKAMLQPYINTISHNATVEGGLPMLRAMMLEEANDYTLGTATQYQYMWGDQILVAPIYQDTNSDAAGNDIRNNIYLPSTSDIWIDYFTGEQYKGGQILNEFDAPIWKLPVFVKNGTILPRYAENNNPEAVTSTNSDGLDRSQRIVEFFPSEETSFTQYEDDGITFNGESATTKYTSKVDGTTAILTAETTKGSYTNMVKERSTEFMVHVSAEPTSVEGFTKVNTKEEYDNATGKVYYYDAAPNIIVKEFATKGSTYENSTETTTPILYVKDTSKKDVTASNFTVVIEGFENDGDLGKDELNTSLATPTDFTSSNVTSSEITLNWTESVGADTYEIEFDGTDEKAGIILSNIKGSTFTQVDLDYDTDYTFRIRAVNKDGYSDWSERITVKTADDPYRNVPEITATWNYGDNWGPLNNAFDHSTETMFHSTNSVSPDQAMILDMQKAYSLDKFEYIPRNDNKGNGTVQKMDIYASLDGNSWTKVYDGSSQPEWTYSNDMSNLDTKTVDLSSVTARYLKLSVTKSKGGFFSAAELTVYKKDGDNGHLVGDTNNSNSIDENDLTFYENYVGLKTVDNDWEYVASLGNFNGNNTIDAYDVAYVARQVTNNPVTEVSASEAGVDGKIKLIPSKTDIKAGDEVIVDVYGIGLKNVYAFNVDFANHSIDTETSISATVKSGLMKNYSKLRVHNDNTRENIVFFSNTGNQELINGTGSIAKVTFKASEDFTWSDDIAVAMLVGKDLSTIDAKVDESIKPEAPETKSVLTAKEVAMTFKNDLGAAADGSNIWQQSNWKSILFDGNNSGNGAEFKWDTESNPVPDEVGLPTDFIMDLGTERFIKSIQIHGRAAGNGVVKSSKAVAYDENDKPIELGNSTSSSPIFEINAKVKKIVWTPLTSGGTATFAPEGNQANRMLTLHEIEIIEDVQVKPTAIVMDASNKNKVYIGSLISLAANITPENASNPFYDMTSSDESIAKIVKIPTTTGYLYALQGLAEGSVTITAKSLADENITTKQTVTVVSGVDTTSLEEELAKVQSLLAEEVLYTPESFATLKATIEAAEAIINTPTSQNEADTVALNLKVAKAGLAYKGSNTEQASSENLIHQAQMAIKSYSNYADSDLPENIIDGKANTIWHSSYQSAASLPVEVVVDLGTDYNLEQIDYLARQSSRNGHVTKYRIEVSTNGTDFSPVVVGTFSNDGTQLNAPGTAKEIKINTTEARYVKFIALESLGDTPNKYASIAELNFYGTIVNENAEVTGIALSDTELEMVIGDVETLVATVLPTGAKGTVLFESGDENIVTVDEDGKIKAIAEGTAKITASISTDNRSGIISECTVTVSKADTSALETKVGEVKDVLAEVEEKDYNKAIIDNAKQIIDEAEALIASGKATENDVADMQDKIAKVEEYLGLLDDLDDMKELVDIDLSIYDSSTIAAFNTAKASAEAVLEDPLENVAKIVETLEALQDAYNSMDILDSTSLEAVVDVAKEIDLATYLDGAEKTAFEDALEAAEDALANATTNAEYASAEANLATAIQNLAVVEKANQATVDKIVSDLNELKDALTNNDYTDANKAIIEDAIIKAEAALADSNLTQSAAESIMSQLNQVLNTTAKDIIKTETEPGTNGGDTGNVETGDTTNRSLYLELVGLSALAILLVIASKKRKAAK